MFLLWEFKIAGMGNKHFASGPREKMVKRATPSSIRHWLLDSWILTVRETAPCAECWLRSVCTLEDPDPALRGIAPYWCLPWWSSGWDSELSMQRAWVQFLVGELRTHMPWGQKVKIYFSGFPGGTSRKELTCPGRRNKRYGFNLGVGKIPWRRKWQPTPVLLTGTLHREAWQATVHGVAKSQTWLKWQHARSVPKTVSPEVHPTFFFF